MSYGYEQTGSAFMNYGSHWAAGQSNNSAAITVGNQGGWAAGGNGYPGVYDDRTRQTTFTTAGTTVWPGGGDILTVRYEAPSVQEPVGSRRAAKHLTPREAWEA